MGLRYATISAWENAEPDDDYTPRRRVVWETDGEELYRTVVRQEIEDNDN
jgi:hypothetical protein